jgi:outer membrane lipoprotein SlyB
MFQRLTPFVAAALLAACATSSPDVIQRSEAQRMAQVQDATVLNVRPVVVDGSQSGVGAVTGAAVGGLAGSARSSGRESAAIGIVGAVVGGVIGNTVERASTREDAVEILVQLKNGERRAIVQAKGSETLSPGDAVIIVTSGGKTRVTKAPPGATAVQPRS